MQEDRNERKNQVKDEEDEEKDEEKDEEFMIDSFCKKMFPLMADLKTSIRIRLRTMKAWPVAPVFDNFYDTMRVLQMDPEKFFPCEIWGSC